MRLGRPMSGAFLFRNRELSVDRERLTSLREVKIEFPEHSFARLTAGSCRAFGLEVVADPLPGNPAHANVVAPTAYSTSMLKDVAKGLRDSAEFPV